MSTVAYITRNMAGTTQHGNSSEGNPARIQAAGAKDISLNLNPADVESYARHGSNLHITLANGQELVLEDFYAFGQTGSKNLFLSEEGQFIEVVLEDKSGGMLFATYEPLDLTGKWSAYDEMVFLDVDRIEPVVAPLAAPLFGGLGAAGAAAAGVAGAAVLAGGGGGGGGGGGNGDGPPSGIYPTVDDPDATHPVSSSTTDPVVITGTGAPGSDVTVTVGTTEVTTTVEDDGTWGVSIPVDELPVDGNYDVDVHVVDPDGYEFDLDGPSVVIDTVVDVDIDAGQAGGDDMINAAEAADGVTLTGTAEAGATVEVTFQGVTRTVTATDAGTWSADFAATEIAAGEYDAEVSVTATDSFGNSETTTGTIRVDTTTAVSIDGGKAGGDDILNSAEAASGLVLTGTGEAGSAVSVTVEGVTRTTTVDGNGNWSATFEAGSLPAGEYDTTVTVTSTDAAGNSATTTAGLRVDTLVDPLTLASGNIEGDNVVNQAERSDGVTLTGTVEPGSTVTVQLGGATTTATVDASGNWSATFAASDIPEGSYDAAVVVTATDAAGNSETITDTLTIDTEVTPLTAAPEQTTDDVLNLAEHAAGLTLTGTVEPGSTVEVTIQGVTHAATVDASGNWSATFASGELAQGTYDTSATIVATDAAGNTQTLTESFSVDTDYSAPDIGKVISAGTSTSAFFSDDLAAGDTVHELTSTGNVSTISGTQTDLADGRVLFEFDADVPDGSQLVLNRVDDAGNSSGTLVVLDDGAGADVLSQAGLSQFNIDELNLDHSDNASLTLTEADINALSGNSDTLVVHGSDNDTLTISGATKTGTQTINEETYNVYTLGDGGTTVIVDEDINTVI
ncbi:Ig-like domain-containing protein [Leisingera sp.]|uniref:Ig-like domain-containing protein n=1 Tax=Leisingera sp. TaxID=1879318 RepID=UPI003A948A17